MIHRMVRQGGVVVTIPGRGMVAVCGARLTIDPSSAAAADCTIRAAVVGNVHAVR